MTNTELLRNIAAAVSSGDVEAVMPFLHESIVIFEEDGGVAARGHDEVRAMFVSLFEQNIVGTIEINETIEIGDAIVAHEVNHVNGADGPTDIHSLWAYKVRDGQLASMYFVEPGNGMKDLLSEV
jgi:ketosteroid isomerase-like protein